MVSKSRVQKDGLITRKDYIKGWLSISWRLPTISRIIKHLYNIGEEDRESWGSMLEENADKFPNNTAIKSEESWLTYRKYNEAVNQYANYFISQGLKKGGVAVVFLENRPELLIVYSAMAKIGVINSMISTNLRQDSLKHCLALHPADVFIVGEEVLEAFEEVKDNLKLLPHQKIYFVPDKGEKPTPAGFIDLNEAVKKYPVINPSTTAQVRPKDTIAYVFTSGTTGGMPKAAVITHGRLVRCKYYNGKIVLNMKPTKPFFEILPYIRAQSVSDNFIQ